MKFEEAMAIMRNGGKVRRPCWKSAYIFIDAEGAMCCGDCMPSSKRFYVIKNVTIPNIMSKDWEEVK